MVPNMPKPNLFSVFHRSVVGAGGGVARRRSARPRRTWEMIFLCLLLLFAPNAQALTYVPPSLADLYPAQYVPGAELLLGGGLLSNPYFAGLLVLLVGGGLVITGAADPIVAQIGQWWEDSNRWSAQNREFLLGTVVPWVQQGGLMQLKASMKLRDLGYSLEQSLLPEYQTLVLPSGTYWTWAQPHPDQGLVVYVPGAHPSYPDRTRLASIRFQVVFPSDPGMVTAETKASLFSSDGLTSWGTWGSWPWCQHPVVQPGEVGYRTFNIHGSGSAGAAYTVRWEHGYDSSIRWVGVNRAVKIHLQRPDGTGGEDYWTTWSFAGEGAMTPGWSVGTTPYDGTMGVMVPADMSDLWGKTSSDLQAGVPGVSVDWSTFDGLVIDPDTGVIPGTYVAPGTITWPEDWPGLGDFTDWLGETAGTIYDGLIGSLGGLRGVVEGIGINLGGIGAVIGGVGGFLESLVGQAAAILAGQASIVGLLDGTIPAGWIADLLIALPGIISDALVDAGFAGPSMVDPGDALQTRLADYLTMLQGTFPLGLLPAFGLILSGMFDAECAACSVDLPLPGMSTVQVDLPTGSSWSGVSRTLSTLIALGLGATYVWSLARRFLGLGGG